MSAGRVIGSVSAGGAVGGRFEMTVCSVGATGAELPALTARGSVDCCEAKSTSTDDEFEMISSAKGRILTYGRSQARLALDERPCKRWKNKPSD
ncbi:MAG: hypothetical protein CMJ64_25270 [Planctomycetaceae bacterium]|nr:hypothetical protein [Planctomycetaceae bacterium]